jgi:hypothetical protein
MDYFNLLNEYHTHSSICKSSLSSLHALHRFLHTVHTSLNEFITHANTALDALIAELMKDNTQFAVL